VDVIVLKHPGVDGTFPFDDVLPEPLKESDLVLVIFEDVRFINSPNHDVVKGAGDIQSSLPWHGKTLVDFPKAVKPFST